MKFQVTYDLNDLEYRPTGNELPGTLLLVLDHKYSSESWWSPGRRRSWLNPSVHRLSRLKMRDSKIKTRGWTTGRSTTQNMSQDHSAVFHLDLQPTLGAWFIGAVASVGWVGFPDIQIFNLNFMGHTNSSLYESVYWESLAFSAGFISCAIQATLAFSRPWYAEFLNYWGNNVPYHSTNRS